MPPEPTACEPSNPCNNGGICSVYSSADSGGVGDCAPSSLGFRCSLVLSGEGTTLHWTASAYGGDASFALQVPTAGYVSVGFSPSGGMLNSAVVLGYLPASGAPGVVGPYRIGDSYAAPTPDPSWTVTQASIEVSAAPGPAPASTIMRFSCRLPELVAGEEAGEAALTRMIWAHSPDGSETVAYHEQYRGEFTINFASGIDEVAGFTCACVDGFSGPTCEEASGPTTGGGGGSGGECGRCLSVRWFQ